MENADSEKKHFENLYRAKSGYLLNLQRKERGNFLNKAKIIKETTCRIQNPKVLEIGCGLGDLTKNISDLDLYACDVSATALLHIKKLLPKVKLLNMAVENLNFEDEFFDVVVGCGILHHANLPLTLPQIEKVLKQNGYFIFFEPNLSFLESYLINKFSFFRRLSTNSPNECYFNKEFIYNELKKYKFKNIKVELYFSYHPKLPAFLIPFNVSLNKILRKTGFEYGARELFILGQKA